MGGHQLTTAETFFNRDGQLQPAIDSGIAPSLWAAWRFTGSGRGASYAAPSGDDATSANALAVFVERGMWMVQCDQCLSAQVSSGDDHRFYCVGPPTGCGNFQLNGLTRAVIWPDEWDEIENILVVRLPIFRNWVPGETIDALRQENEDHGLVNS